MSADALSAVEKVKYVTEYLDDLKTSVDRTFDLVQLLKERLVLILGNEIPLTTINKSESEFPLGQNVMDITDISKSANNLLDSIISRLRI